MCDNVTGGDCCDDCEERRNKIIFGVVVVAFAAYLWWSR